MYSDRLLHHFSHPQNVGDLAPPAITVNVMNPACGDQLRLAARFDGETVAEVRYRTRGCTASIAAGSALTEWMQGRTLTELSAISPAVVQEAVGGLPPESNHAAVLCVEAVRALLARRAQS